MSVEDCQGDQVDHEPQPLDQDHLATSLEAGILQGLGYQEQVGPGHEDGMLVPPGSSWPGRGWQGVGDAQAGEDGGDGGYRKEKDKEVGEKNGGDVEEGTLSQDSDAKGESAKVGHSRGDKERGAAKEGDNGACLPFNLPLNFLAKWPICAVW